MSTVGNIVFSFIMMSVSLVLIVESIRDIASNATNPSTDGTTDFHVPAIVAVSVAFFVKLCLFCYCWGLREYPQVPTPRPPKPKTTFALCQGGAVSWADFGG